MMKKAILQSKIAQLPQNTGVYFFYGKGKELLYIGKATNLKSRVQSYFRSDIMAGRSEWIAKMVSQIEDIKFQEADSVLEALILESNLIKKYQPKYNTLERDDKSFAYFVITKEEFPSVFIFRKTDIDFENLKAKSYKLKAIFGPYTSKQQMQIALKIIRKIFPFHNLKQKTEKGCLDFQIGMCPGPYAGAISKKDYEKNIQAVKMILEGKKQGLLKKLKKEMNNFSKKEEFEKAAKLRNKIFALQHIRDIALINKDFDLKIMHDAKYEMQNIRIEAYDISNISGQSSVGSMVVFENLSAGQAGWKPNKAEYRKFKIKTVDGANDVASMKEVLFRRFKNDWAMPELILLDGGLGHLNMAKKLLHKKLGLAINIASVAKGPTRKKLDIRIALINTKLQNNNLVINKILKNNLLLKGIMDEAHRFAITYHRKLRNKKALQ